MSAIEVAIYARFSSDNQQDASIDDQVRNCHRLCEQKGWRVVAVHSDRALSGANTLRPGYQQVMADARAGKFKVLVAEGLDRLSRDQATTASLFKLLTYLGIMIYTSAEGEVNELHIGMKGTFNALALKDLAMKTHRGVEGRVRKGRSGGGRAFGYKMAPSRGADGAEERGLREIVESEASTVRRIFAEFAAGKSPRAISKGLNADGIKGPNGKMWRNTTIRGHATRRTGILRNSTYIGRPEWNKQTYVRNPDTGQRVARVRPEAERVVVEVQTLRIVDQAVWDAVQARLDAIRSSARSQKLQKIEFWNHRRAKNLLSGLTYCGKCGASMAAIGKDYLSCASARHGAGCDNRKSIRRHRVEEVVLDGLKTRLMAPDAVREFTEAVHAEVNRQSASDELARSEHQAELNRVSKKLKGFYDAIADGLRTPGLKSEVEALESRQAELRALIEAAPAPKPRFHPRLADIYRQTVANLHAALGDPDARPEAAELLRSLIERVTIAPAGDGYVIELTGDIVKMVTLPGGSVPDLFARSVKVVAGARNSYCSHGRRCASEHETEYFV